MRPIQDAFPLLQTPRKIFITTHHKPDGDAIGSMLGLYHYLVKKGHTVTAVSPSELPDFLMWMPGVEHLLNYEAESKAANRAHLGHGRNKVEDWWCSRPTKLPPCCGQARSAAATWSGRSENRHSQRTGPGPRRGGDALRSRSARQAAERGIRSGRASRPR